MKPQTILVLTGIAAGLMSVSCQSSNTGKNLQDEGIDADYYAKVNAHIDRRLNEFNEKEEAALPVFSPAEAKADFQGLSFIKSSEQISLLSIDFSAAGDEKWSFVVDRESRTLTRRVGDKEETFSFEPFTNGIPPVIPYEAHILYAFVTDFNRIAQTVTLRSFDRLEKGENPAVARMANEANLDKNGKKIDKNFVEVKPKVISEPVEFRIDNRWCHCYDVKLKSVCAPAVSMSLFVSNEEKTISRVDLILEDGSKKSFIMDWREQDGIVLPRVVSCVTDNIVLFREDAKVILKDARAIEDATAAADAVVDEPDETEAPPALNSEDDASEDDASEDDVSEDDFALDDEE